MTWRQMSMHSHAMEALEEARAVHGVYLTKVRGGADIALLTHADPIPQLTPWPCAAHACAVCMHWLLG
jgi:hypothetical protein